MTSARDSETLTRVGKGTPMGDFMREYWIPAAASDELQAGGAPMRLMLLGEKLIAFRDSTGQVGIMDHRCPHRCASLFFGRNEDGGLRCIYHGWKFAADGTCLDMPNLPPHQHFKDKVRARAYPVAERNGLSWTYMGPRAEPPPLPLIEAALLPIEERGLFFAQRECNWLQALEGEVDTSHFSFLHYGAIDPETLDPDSQSIYNALDRAPGYEVVDTPWGTMYGAWRPTRNSGKSWRIAQFLFPFWTMPPDGDFEGHVWARAWVPMDDTHTMFLQLRWNHSTRGERETIDGDPLVGLGYARDYLPNTTDWHGRWRLANNASNDYGIDRAVQAEGSFSGIDGLMLQDQAITESMGPIVDHSLETLAPSDRMIVRTRNRLRDAAVAFADDGTAPPGVDDPETYLRARSGDYAADADTDWRDAYAERMRQSENPTGRLRIDA